MNAAPCEICGRENRVTAPKPREKLHPFARFTRWMLSPLGWPTHILTGAFFALAVWEMTVNWVISLSGVLFLGLLFSGLLLALGWFTRLTTRGAVWLFAPATRQNKRPGVRGFLLLPLCLTVLWMLNHFHVPLRMGFWLSRARLEQVPPVAVSRNARFFAKGGKLMSYRFAGGARAGFYRARQVDISGQSFRIVVGEQSFIFDNTTAGFAKCPQGCEGANFSVLHPASQRPTYLHLSDDWYWWEEMGRDF